MGAGQESLDVVVHAEGRVSLIVAAAHMAQDGLVLAGTLMDPDIAQPADTSIHVAFDRQLVEGAHVPRETEFSVVVDDETGLLRWVVETQDLSDGYRLHDARVDSDVGEMRAFAIEDLTATVGIGLAVAVGAVWVWRTTRRAKHAREDLKRMWDECLARGGSPKVSFDGQDMAGLDIDGRLQIKSGVKVSVECDMSSAKRGR